MILIYILKQRLNKFEIQKADDEKFFLKNQFYASNVDEYEILKLEEEKKIRNKNSLSNHMIQNQQKSSITTTHHL